MAKWVKNRHSVRDNMGSIPGFTQWVKDLAIAASCSIGRRFGSDPLLPWLWHRLAVAALIRTLAWELPCATGVALKKQKKKEKRENKTKYTHIYICVSPNRFSIQQQLTRHCKSSNFNKIHFKNKNVIQVFNVPLCTALVASHIS